EPVALAGGVTETCAAGAGGPAPARTRAGSGGGCGRGGGPAGRGTQGGNGAGPGARRGRRGLLLRLCRLGGSGPLGGQIPALAGRNGPWRDLGTGFGARVSGGSG